MFGLLLRILAASRADGKEAEGEADSAKYLRLVFIGFIRGLKESGWNKAPIFFCAIHPRGKQAAAGQGLLAKCLDRLADTVLQIPELAHENLMRQLRAAVGREIVLHLAIRPLLRGHPVEML